MDGALPSVMHGNSRVAGWARAQHQVMSIAANPLGVVLNGLEPKGGWSRYPVYGYPLRTAPVGVGLTDSAWIASHAA